MHRAGERSERLLAGRNGDRSNRAFYRCIVFAKSYRVRLLVIDQLRAVWTLPRGILGPKPYPRLSPGAS